MNFRGASPIMANEGNEAEELARLEGALVINTGTVTPEGIANFLQALRAYNTYGGPVLLDPVGVGATGIRRDAIKALMSGGYFSVIKGNENEIAAIWDPGQTQQKGVDSGKSSSSRVEKALLAKKLATREQNVVLMTGVVDYLSDGDRTYEIKNGHAYLGKVTGCGCTLGTTVASCLAVEQGDKLLAVLSGVLMFEIAAEHAARREDVKGPGTFVPAFLDELAVIKEKAEKKERSWLDVAKVEQVDI